MEEQRESGYMLDAHGFVYGLRLVALVFVLITASVLSPLLVPQIIDAALGTPTQEARNALIESDIALLQAKRTRNGKAEMRSLIEAYAKNEKTIATRAVAAQALEQETLIAANLHTMQLYLYREGEIVETFPIASKGKDGSRWQTPTGLYTIHTKEENHSSSVGNVHMPFSMQFFGNFFIHGWPSYADGEPVAQGFSEGCIRLSTEDAEKVFAFAQEGTPVFVYDEPQKSSVPVALSDTKTPRDLSAVSYLLADAHTGRVYYEKNTKQVRPIASMSKLMTALVANEAIHYDQALTIAQNDGQTQGDFGKLTPGAHMVAGEALYPLLLESNNAVAHALARHYGQKNFIRLMNEKARAIGARTLSFADASGISPYNRGSAEDIFKLARYLLSSQSFILDITQEKKHAVEHTLFTNMNHFSEDDSFVGGKTGFTTAAAETMVAVFDVPVENTHTTVIAVVLGSSDRKGDIQKLVDQFRKVAIIDEQYLAEHSPFTASVADALYAKKTTPRIIAD